jgi:hypothetical protein
MKLKEISNVEGQYIFYCPGCKKHHSVWVKPSANSNGAAWTWNGSKEVPTFSPSILVNYRHWTPPVTSENYTEYKLKPWPQTQVDAICHSFVTDGKIQFLNDCTHSLAGKTVELPEIDSVL